VENKDWIVVVPYWYVAVVLLPGEGRGVLCKVLFGEALPQVPFCIPF